MNTKHVILIRQELDTEDEYTAAKASFRTEYHRTAVLADSIVIGRYSVLPYYDELWRELWTRCSRLVNTPSEHRFIADVAQWANEDGPLCGMTPRAYTRWDQLPAGAYVVKGRTNSRKQQWSTRMFAPTADGVPEVARRLYDDALLVDQGLVARPFVPLRQLDTGLNGLPICNEWRTFWWRQPDGTPKLVASGFYWSTHPEARAAASFPAAGVDFAFAAAIRFAPHAAFFVLDIAETATGDWIVIEANDGQMSGLSCIDPADFYPALAAACRDERGNW